MSLEHYRRQRTRQKQAAALDAARTAFGRDGFTRASTAEIAKAAGMSTATLYRHFPTKAHLFRRVIELELAHLGEALTGAAEDPERALLALALAYADLLSKPSVRGLVRAFVSEAGRDSALVEMFQASAKDAIGAAFVQRVSAYLRLDGPKAAPHALRAAAQLQGMIEHGTLLVGLVAGDHARSAFSPEEVARDAFQTWLCRWGRVLESSKP